ncbi:MAG TPA: SGNH/GDSL hydrolase family protein [Kiritimatiellia bacterium]|nr:SGNH/GDSL hydrolase family protein [Kiritimatiellia bacterium]
MRTASLGLIAGLMLGLGCARPEVEVGEMAQVLVLPLGDSITQGDRGHNSYRRPLWHALNEGECRVGFVGSQRRNHWGGPPDKDFDLAHEGHWGWQVDEVLAELPHWLTLYPAPDIALIHLGSNDLFRGRRVPDILADFEAMIGVLRQRNPSMVLLVAQLIPASGMEAQVAAFNEALVRLEGLSTEASPVVMVDQFSGFDVRRMTYDGVHPNREGEERIAGRWLEVMAPFVEAVCRGR